MISDLPFQPSSSDNGTGVDASSADSPRVMGLPLQFILVMIVLALQLLKKGQEHLLAGRLGEVFRASTEMLPEGLRKKAGSVLMSTLGGIGSLAALVAAGKVDPDESLSTSYRRVRRRDSENSGAMFELD